MPGKNMDRADAKSAIMMIFINDYKLGKVDELTAVQVARGLCFAPSWHVRKMLAELVSEGRLEMRAEGDARCSNLPETSGQKYWYKLSQKVIRDVEGQARDINVKISGVTVGQLRMF